MTRVFPLMLFAAASLASAGCTDRGPARIERPVQTAQAVFQVAGMNCESCEMEIEDAVQRLDGVVSVRASLPDSLVIVELDPSRVRAETIESSIERLGYEAVLGAAANASANSASTF